MAVVMPQLLPLPAVGLALPPRGRVRVGVGVGRVAVRGKQGVWAYKGQDEEEAPKERPKWRQLRPVEERYNVRVERNVKRERADELGVWHWSKWESGSCAYSWQWRVDQEVFIVKGAMQVVPDEGEGCAWFYAGDFLRFPKWFSAHLSFSQDYLEHYRFRAYGDD